MLEVLNAFPTGLTKILLTMSESTGVVVRRKLYEENKYGLESFGIHQQRTWMSSYKGVTASCATVLNGISNAK